MPYRYDFNINLKQDWFDILKERLKMWGYNIAEIGVEVSHMCRSSKNCILFN